MTTPRAQVPRWRQVDPVAVHHAVAGLLAAHHLTTDEKRRVVEHLTAIEHLSDAEIAVRLRWVSWDHPRRPGQAVTSFRFRWGIPAGLPSGVNARYRRAVAA